MKLFLLMVLFTFLSLQLSKAINTTYYPRYHVAPEKGWMNDPNGFCFFKGFYHLFYQYNPYSSLEPGIAHWGHVRSKDLVTWERLPIAMYPDKYYDKDGVYSGSAIVEDDTMYIYYTGNINLDDKIMYHNERQAMAMSKDGINVVKYIKNPIILGTHLQPNIRDPKVWKHGDVYYMVLGNTIGDKVGQVVLYTSSDKFSWSQASILAKSNGTLGFMWETPDFFELNGRFVFVFSPQGIQPDGYKYRNLYQSGYIVGSFDYETKKFVQEIDFRELDHGHDFYATQTFDDNGRRILIGWMDTWEKVYPEQADGWTGQMTLPRILTLSDDGTILQNPIEKIEKAHDKILYSENKKPKTPVYLPNKAGKVTIEAAADRSLELVIQSQGTNMSTVSIKYDCDTGFVILNRGGDDGTRMTPWSPSLGENLKLCAYVDASSIELFFGKGEVTFSSRFFPAKDVSVYIRRGEVSKMKVVSLKPTLPLPGGDCALCNEINTSLK